MLVDKILEDFQSITTASCLDALEALSPHTTSESLSAILSRLERLSIDLQCLPRVPVEPCSLIISMDAGEARVVAPRALLAANFSIDRVPSHTRLGFSLTLYIRVASDSPPLTSDELAVALPAAASYIDVNARTVFCSSQLVSGLARPTVSLVPDIEGKCLRAVLTAPPGAESAQSMAVDGIFVAGAPLPTAALPAVVIIRRGLNPGKILEESTNNLQTPCITPSGIIIVPRDGSSIVHVFDNDGTALEGIPREFGIDKADNLQRL